MRLRAAWGEREGSEPASTGAPGCEGGNRRAQGSDTGSGAGVIGGADQQQQRAVIEGSKARSGAGADARGCDEMGDGADESSGADGGDEARQREQQPT